MSQGSEAKAVEEIVLRQIAKPEVIEVARGTTEKASVLLTPTREGTVQVHPVKPILDAYLQAPERRQGTARLTDLASFIRHVNRFKAPESALFANPDQRSPSLTCVFDYHPEGPDNTKAKYGQHRTLYSFPVSEEWKAWSGADGKPMDQSTFAHFLEDRVADVQDPDPKNLGELARAYIQKLGLGVTFATPQHLLELSRGLSIRVNEGVRNQVKLESGEAQIQYTSEHVDEAGKPLRVPAAFLLLIPVFKFGAVYEVAARLRYRIQDCKVIWFFNLHRTDLIFDTAFTKAFKQAEAETGLPLFQGSPEGQ